MVRKSIKYGERTIEYSVLYSDRKTLTIIVNPDGSVLVRAPKRVSEKKIEERVQKKSKWIVKHLDFFKKFKPLIPQRQYISGETHLYLGRRYRLKTNIHSEEKVVATRGCLVVHAKNKDPERIKNIVDKWYREKALEHFSKSLNNCFEKFEKMGFSKPSLKIRKMKTRWGSYSTKGNVTLNLELIKKPKECIDYVVMHELCHMKQKNHGDGFYDLLFKVFPEWRGVKEMLEKPE